VGGPALSAFTPGLRTIAEKLLQTLRA